MAITTKKLSVSIDSNLYDAFEEMRKKYGKDNRSEEVQKAIEIRVKQWKRRELEKECEEASRDIPFDVEDSYEAQGKALESRLS